jgi:hypothetical protein
MNKHNQTAEVSNFGHHRKFGRFLARSEEHLGLTKNEIKKNPRLYPRSPIIGQCP